MNLRRISFSLPFRIYIFLFLAGFLLASAALAPAQGTHLWTQSRFEEFEKGTPQGVEISSDGKLRRGPAVSEVFTTSSTFVWAVVADTKKPEISYLATGSPATVLRISPDGKGGVKSDKLFETKSLSVQVLRMGPDGDLYAATMPDGRVYRLKADASAAQDESSAEVVFDLAKAEDVAKAEDKSADKLNSKTTDQKAAEGKTGDAKSPDGKSRYIWDMAFDSHGLLYIATGGPGAVYRMDPKNKDKAPETFFKSDEQHIRTLAWDLAGKTEKRDLLAGSDGSGLVYRISPEGKAYVVFSAPRREVTALAVGADGTIYEADVGDKAHNPLPQLPIQGGGNSITISFVSPGSVQAANASTALPEGTEIFALTPNAAPRKVWSGKDEVVYQLAATRDGVTAFTGNRGRVLNIHADGSFSDIAHLDAQQAVAMADLPGGWLVGTANTGKLFKLENGPSKAVTADDHSYASDVLDAGAAAQWGRVEVDPASHGYQILTRSGNVEQPVRNAKDWGWSDWQPVVEGKIASPVGRYLQWKVALSEGAEVAGIGVNYLPVNAAPSVDDVLVVPGTKFVPQNMGGQIPTVTISFPNGGQNGGIVLDPGGANASAPIQAQKDRTSVTVRWNAHDDNGDDMSYDLSLRGDGETVWRPLKKGLTERVYSFDGSTLPDGGYKIRVVASDAPSHTPGDALTGELVSERFELDTTAPIISGLKAQAIGRIECSGTPCQKGVLIPVTFNASDATSPISRAEYSLDSGKWQYVEPVGRLSDAKQEHYSFQIDVPMKLEDSDGQNEIVVREAAKEHLITVRAYDRHDNVATAKIVVPIPGVKANKTEAK